MKILVVDDNFVNRKIICKHISHLGETHVAVNGREALEALQLAHQESEPYDLILLDIMMPEMDGHEALRAIREYEKEHGILTSDGVKIIMVTALNDPKNIMHAFREGCEHYITKPVKRELLFEAMRKLELLRLV